MRTPYSTLYSPPAPVMEIWLAAPEETFLVGPLIGLVDSGADATIIPAGHLRLLPVQIDDRKLLRGQWGESRVVDVYLLDIGVDDMRLPVVEIVADDRGSDVIIGRNVLNKLHLLLDGPAQMTEVNGW